MQLENSLEDLSVELLTLKHITDGLNKKGGPREYPWLQRVERISRIKDDIQNNLHKWKRWVKSDMKVIEECTMKVAEYLEVVKDLKDRALDTFLHHATGDKLKRVSTDDLIIITSEFSTEIGSGGFSKVYKGKLSDGVHVAVKVLTQKDDITKDVLQDVFVLEVSTMIKSSHPNLIKLYGFCFSNTMMALIYEYMENGSFEKVLFKKGNMLESQRLYDIAIGIAKVLAYLHHDCDDQIIHLDIKPANVLLDSKFSPKVTDFGLAKIMNKAVSHFTMSKIKGTVCYIAPEMLLQSSRVTYTCDVYSFGMLLFNILGVRIKNPHSFANEVWIKFDKGELDETINECEIWEKDKASARILSIVALWCIQFTPEIRPSMKDVVNALEKKMEIARPPNPFLSSNKLLSMQQSEDLIYSTVSAITCKSVSGRNLTVSSLDYSAYMQKWREATFEEEWVERLPSSSLQQFSHRDLQSFTKGFSTKVRPDVFANIYKGEFPNGMQIVVKVLPPVEKFRALIKYMFLPSHRNIIKIHGFCSERNTNALVFEYMANGSLDMLWAENRVRDIDLDHLYCIAVGTAKGISYLHHGRNVPIVHMDINPSHILLDSYLTPKITNFNATLLEKKVFPPMRPSLFMAAHKVLMAVQNDTFSYIAIETMMSGIKSSKSNVYSFGMILFVIFGSRRNYQENSNSRLQVYWEKFDNGQIEELLSECGFREKDRQNAMTLLMVAFWCIQYTPENRPPMTIVVKMLLKEMEVMRPPNPFLALEPIH